MAVYRRKTGIYHYDFEIRGVRFHGSTHVRSKAQAREVERIERERARLGCDASDLSIDVAAKRFWLEHAQFKKSASTTFLRLAILTDCIPVHTRMGDITSATVAEVIARRRARLAGMNSGWKAQRLATNATVNRDIIDTTLRPILNRARKVWGAKALPVIDWKDHRLTEPRERVREFSEDELGALLPNMLPHWRDFFEFALRYGPRLREMFFPLDAVDVKGWRVTLRERKEDDDHVLPILEEDAQLLAIRIGRARAAKLDTVWFWEDRRGDLRPCTPRGAQSYLMALFRRHGVKDARPHDARHHAGTQILRATGSLKLVQRLLGHSSITSSARYAHANEDDLRRGIEAVSRHSPDAANAKPKKAEAK